MELLGYFTSKGEALSAKLLMGTPLTITRVTAGDGETPADADALMHDRQALPVGTMLRDGPTVTLPVTLVAAAAADSYPLKELGVYAEDPDEGEILYRIYRTSQPMDIRADSPLTIRFYLKETVSDAAEVTVCSAAAGILTVADRGVPAGVAALDASGTVPPAQLPYSWGTEDLEDGVSPLAPGRLYFVCAAGALPGPESGGSGNGMLSFTIGDTKCTADAGMTWNEWIASAYYAAAAALQLQVSPATSYVTHPEGWVRNRDGGNVYGTDLLQAGGIYVLGSADDGSGSDGGYGEGL